MRSRGLVVAIAVVLAVLAAVGVIVYTNNVRDEVIKENTEDVIVSIQDIPANTQLNDLIAQGVFEVRAVPTDVLVAGAVTSIDELRDQVTSAPIFANEQIPISRLTGGELNLIGISEGHIGVGTEVAAPRAVNGLIQRGDNVVVYATFERGTPILKATLKAVLSPPQIDAFFEAIQGATGTAGANLGDQDVILLPFDYTVTLVRSVKVLAVQNPVVDQATGRQSGGQTTLVLDLLPSDASEFVFANEMATLYLGLLPPENEEGYQDDGVIGPPFIKVIGVSGQ